MIGDEVWLIALRRTGSRCIVGSAEGGCVEGGGRAAEETYWRIGMNDPVRQQGAEELLSGRGELVEESLDGRQTQNDLACHHLPGGYAPTPVDVMGIRLEDGPDGEA